jgi:hypothetical protein
VNPKGLGFVYGMRREGYRPAIGVTGLAAQDPDHSLPEFVIVPARPGTGSPEMETRYTPNGPEIVRPAFTSVAKRIGMPGRGQPWICVPLREARQAAAAEGLARVVIDPEEMA